MERRETESKGEKVIYVIKQAAGHLYDKEGNPVFEVPKKSGKGMKKTTLREARELDLLPSVTSIQKIIAKEGLQRWIQEQLVMSALTLPKEPEEALEDFAKRIIEDSGKQASEAAELGSNVHRAIEEYMATGAINTEYEQHIAPVIKWINETMSDKDKIKTEVSFACTEGYGGRVDCVYNDMVIDWKTQGTKGGKFKQYPEHGEQLAAYANGLGIEHADLINVYISTTEVGLIEVYRWTNNDDLLAQFGSSFHLWKSRNNW